MLELWRRLRTGRPVVVVSGLPRSGTSMAMKMLAAAGLELVTDDVRTADEDNPKGYFEDERVKDLAGATDRRWVATARGKVIKVVSSLLLYLPPQYRYRVVFRRRDLDEVLASPAKMLERRGEGAATGDEELRDSYVQHLEKVAFQLRYRPNFEALYVDYRDVLENPEVQAQRIADFLGGGLDVARMAEAVDPNLYRNRREDLVSP